MFLLRRSHEFDAAGFQFVVGFLNIVTSKSAMEEGTDFGLVHGEENEMSVRTADAQLNPSLFVVVGLVRHQFESKLLGIEGQRLVLISSRYADEFDVSDHNFAPLYRSDGNIDKRSKPVNGLVICYSGYHHRL